MEIKDPFSYSARHDSVGLDCSNCKHQSKVSWPNVERSYSCMFHNVSLEVELDKNGYKEGEWFCQNFDDNGTAFPKSVEEFQSIKQKLQPKVLYGCYGTENLLKQIRFEDLSK